MLKYITVSKETEASFTNTGKTYQVKVLKKKKVVTYTTDPEVYAKANANITCLDLLSRITITKHCKELEFQLKEFKPLLTLQNCLHIPLSIDFKEIPESIYFKKTTILYHMSNINKKVLLTHHNFKSLI